MLKRSERINIKSTYCFWAMRDPQSQNGCKDESQRRSSFWQHLYLLLLSSIRNLAHEDELFDSSEYRDRASDMEDCARRCYELHPMQHSDGAGAKVGFWQTSDWFIRAASQERARYYGPRDLVSILTTPRQGIKDLVEMLPNLLIWKLVATHTCEMEFAGS